jgi:DNA-binding MarR family transcriptional regulator
MKQEYLAVLAIAERIHRRVLDRLQLELAQLNILDVNAVQAMILFNIGLHEVTAKDLINRGWYQGTSISYNLKRLTETGYIIQARSENDRRHILIKLTDRGASLVRLVDLFYSRLVDELSIRTIDESKLEACRAVLTKMDMFAGLQADELTADVDQKHK